ncbi:unnamed protein product [Paramecium sonneborni]|uniref:XPG N-terminal domain-containing protein n=1 Tax=Paramecium sonneborni TaxID=65129 RepID=A0A8S1PQH4_9CILI|nr:unnamed protein product [Paramecium sonneborni]
MGVYNLWKLLAAAGRNVDITSLRGLRVAIDVSIWMIKLLHGMSNAGVNYENVHLIGILKRIMFILENGIKPIFVFDGQPPELKRQTLIKRAQQRQQYNINLQKLAEKYVVKLIEKGYDLTLGSLWLGFVLVFIGMIVGVKYYQDGYDTIASTWWIEVGLTILGFLNLIKAFSNEPQSSEDYQRQV